MCVSVYVCTKPYVGDKFVPRSGPFWNILICINGIKITLKKKICFKIEKMQKVFC